MKKIFILSISLLLFSCDKEASSNKDLDREAMIENYGNIILSKYAAAETNALLLENAVNAFVTTLDTTTLIEAQKAFLSFYRSYQTMSFLEFGPAEELILRDALNTYPTDTFNIKLIIQSGIYSIPDVANRSKGLPAIEYMLFGTGSTQEQIVAWYNASNRKNYLLALTAEVKRLQTLAHQAWKSSGGNYYKTFTDAQGLDVNSALGMMVNALSLDFEKFTRDGKVGIPLGVRTLGVPQLDKVEAYYSKQSLALFIHNISALKNYLQGESGQGILTYLDAIDAKYNNEALSVAIVQKLDKILSKAQAMDGTLAYNITNNKAEVDALYAACQELLLLIKIDMTSAMSILITYQDTDGD